MEENDYNILNANSVNVYMLPFTNANSDSEFVVNIEELKKLGWLEKDLSLTSNIDYDSLKTNFACHQYFNESSKRIFGSEDKEDYFCKVFELPKEILQGATYEIITNDIKYKLNIRSIELHLYNFNVGILLFTVSNDDYHRYQDIKVINDLSRRISMSYLPGKIANDMNLSTADYVRISKDNNVLVEHNYKQIILDSILREHKGLDQLREPMPLIDFILNNKFNKSNTTSRIAIHPFDDDRMFLMCFIRNTELSSLIENHFNDDYAKDLLYSIIYVDKEDSTCQNSKMRDDLLDNSMDKRWSNYGTLHAVTNYSFFLITSKFPGINDSVIRPFLYEYKYLMSLVLAQRFAIIRFSALALRYAKLEKVERKVVKLKEEYCRFENQFLLSEMTNQDQGIEMYRLMQKQLFVKEELQALMEPLNNLGDIAKLRIDEIKNRRLLVITLLGSFFAAYGIIMNLEENVKTAEAKAWILVLIVGLILIFVYCVITHKEE